MAIAIKSIPVLKNTEAKRFNKNAKTALNNKRSVSFGDHIRMTDAILKKAKM